MPEYQYKCSGCRHYFITLSRTDIPPCPLCGTLSKRQYSFGIRKSMPEHFNTSVGSYVSNQQQFKEALKVLSEEQSSRVGMDHNYEYVSPADMHDMSAHGVTEEGLEATERAWHDTP